jgi:hypothetical protein
VYSKKRVDCKENSEAISAPKTSRGGTADGLAFCGMAKTKTAPLRALFP